tara:strand:+ start:25503 stop:26735 length:1233 start_codon:yes stop_codon:yes gene_type:complete
MSEGGIELKELTYGQLNNLRENDSNASGDRRRTDPVTALRIATERAFSRDTLRGVSEFYGIVVGRRTITTAIYDYRPTILNSFSTITQTDVAKDEEPVLHDVNINQFLYKVYIPELQPLCPPTSFDDPIIFNYPDVGVDFPLGGKTDIALGAFVTVRYEDPGNLFGPKIVKVSDEVLRIKNLSVDGAGNKRIFKDGIAATIGGNDTRDHLGRLVPGSIEGCADATATGFKVKKNILDEPIVTSEIVPNAYGGFIKGKTSFVKRVEVAFLDLKSQGITLSIGDSLRSYETQRSAYMNKGQPGQPKFDTLTNRSRVAHPCAGYHTEGQAMDIEQTIAQRTDILAHGPIYQALYNAGLRRINREFWHWSLGEAHGHSNTGAGGHSRNNVFKQGVGTSPPDTFRPGSPEEDPSV